MAGVSGKPSDLFSVFIKEYSQDQLQDWAEEVVEPRCSQPGAAFPVTWNLSRQWQYVTLSIDCSSGVQTLIIEKSRGSEEHSYE